MTSAAGLPPGPAQSRAVQTMRWAFRPVPFMREAAAAHGDMFTIRLAQVGDLVFVTHPAAVKEVFTGDPAVLLAGEGNAPLAPVLGSASVLLLDGPEHLRQRRLLLPPFHGERMARYGRLMESITADAVDRWSEHEPFALAPQMQAITLEVILRAVFGADTRPRLQALRAAIAGLLPRGFAQAAMLPWLRRDLGPFMPWARFEARLAAADRLIYDLIATRRADPALAKRDDILSLLLLARDEDGAPMTDAELRDELVTLLLAGHETTATGLAWAVERLVRTPDVLAELTAECRAGGHGPEGGPLLDATVKEILRLRPPLPIVVRRLAAPYEIGGRLLPAGARVAPCIWLTHRRPDLYPDPDAFQPERFLGVTPDTYAWLPFGGGIRRCIGAAFAQFEMKIVLGAILARADLAPAAPEFERTARRAIVLVPERGARAVVTARHHPPASAATAAVAPPVPA